MVTYSLPPAPPPKEQEETYNVMQTVNTEQNDNKTRFVALHSKISPQPLPHCVPSDSVSQSATVSICSLCCIWFGYYEQ